jgi:hypothetical protein
MQRGLTKRSLEVGYSQKLISRILHTLVLRGENWLSALVRYL